MRLLVLGGTSFVGRHLVDAALAHGHLVTVFNRGRTNPGLFPQAEHRRGDRDNGHYQTLAAGTWDATVDVSAYVPRHVDQALDALDGRHGHYVLVSSISAYDPRAATTAEDSSTHPRPAPDTETITPLTYGPLKAACERRAAARLGSDEVALVRPTYVVGPHDPTDRFTYWVRLMTHGGKVPIAWPQAPVQVIDARDLGAFLLTVAQNRHSGQLDAVGPWAPLSRFLSDLSVPGRPYELVDVGPEALAAAKVTLPLVSGDPADRPLMTRPGTHAVNAGLQTRSLRQTAADTAGWDRHRGRPPLTTGPGAQARATLLG